MSGMLERLETEIVECMATMLLNTDTKSWGEISEYRRGWIEGYGRLYVQLCGKTLFTLIADANKMIEGSGHELKM